MCNYGSRSDKLTRLETQRKTDIKVYHACLLFLFPSTLPFDLGGPRSQDCAKVTSSSSCGTGAFRATCGAPSKAAPSLEKAPKNLSPTASRATCIREQRMLERPNEGKSAKELKQTWRVATIAITRIKTRKSERRSECGLVPWRG